MKPKTNHVKITTLKLKMFRQLIGGERFAVLSAYNELSDTTSTQTSALSAIAATSWQRSQLSRCHI